MGLKDYPADFIGPITRFDRRTSIPTCPPGVSVNDNIKIAEKMDEEDGFSPFWFRNQVKNKGPWDYKQCGSQYEAFGNFNYGATGMAHGFTEEQLLTEAGRAQRAAGTSRPEWGDPGDRLWPLKGNKPVPPYGDDPRDQFWIKQGIDYYKGNKKFRDQKATEEFFENRRRQRP